MEPLRGPDFFFFRLADSGFFPNCLELSNHHLIIPSHTLSLFFLDLLFIKLFKLVPFLFVHQNF